jgi:transposase
MLSVTPEKGVLDGTCEQVLTRVREQAVELVKASDKTVAKIARDLGINDTTLGNWVMADRA